MKGHVVGKEPGQLQQQACPVERALQLLLSWEGASWRFHPCVQNGLMFTVSVINSD